MLDNNEPGLENPSIPEGINSSSEHPLKEFFWLLVGVTVFIVLAVGALSLSAGWLAKYIPFEYENQLAGHFVKPNTSEPDIESRLQGIADRLAVKQDLPDGMQITVHYSDSEIVNAFATLGGHIYVFRGLIEVLPSEDALAMVIAHEIAHIKHRHPIRALGRGVTIGIAISAILGVSGSTAGDKLLGEIGFLTALSFSRTQERVADSTALAALVSVYGHGNGATELFEVFTNLEREQRNIPEILRTHPHSKERLEQIHEKSAQNGWIIEGRSLPMPKILQKSAISLAEVPYLNFT